MADEELLDIRVRRSRHAVVLTLVGELDVLARPRLREEVARQIASRPPLLVLDLSGLTFIDAQGLGALATARRLAAECSGRLLIVGADPRLRSLLRITRLAAVLPVYGSVAEALAAQA
jgi:anti-sigma B factor antagonist